MNGTTISHVSLIVAAISGTGVALIFVALCWQDIRAWFDRKIACRHTAAWEQQALAIANDLCDYPPCSPEDFFFCPVHKPRGKHHPAPLRYSPIPPTVHTITDLENWR